MVSSAKQGKIFNCFAQLNHAKKLPKNKLVSKFNIYQIIKVFCMLYFEFQIFVEMIKNQMIFFRADNENVGGSK